MYDKLKKRLNGAVYTVFTPFKENYEVDLLAVDKYISHLYETGARNFYVMPYNSRYSQLSNDEIMELNSFVARRAKAIDSNNLVIVGDPIHCSTQESIRFAARAKDAGADIISLIMREKYFTDDQVLEHFAAIGRESGMPILIHEMPFLSGYNGKQMHWPESLLNRLHEIPEIIALKEDAKDFDAGCRALQLEPRIKVVMAGRKSSFIRYRDYGGTSYLNGISILDARIGIAFSKAFEDRDDEIMNFIMEKIEAPFFDKCAGKYGWHRVNKALLQAAGLMHRRDRMPLKALNDEEYIEIEHIYKEILPHINSLVNRMQENA